MIHFLETSTYQILQIFLNNHFIFDNLYDISVLNQLCKSITNKQIEPYVKKILIKKSKLVNFLELKRFTNLKTLYIYDNVDLTSICNLNNLCNLHLFECKEIPNLKNSKLVKNLKVLDIFNPIIIVDHNTPFLFSKDFTNIGFNQFINLDILFVRYTDTQINNPWDTNQYSFYFSQIEQLTNLTFIYLKNLNTVSTINFDKFIHLQYINIISCYFLKEISGIKKLTKLKLLNIESLFDLTNIIGIEELKINVLLIHDCKRLILPFINNEQLNNYEIFDITIKNIWNYTSSYILNLLQGSDSRKLISIKTILSNIKNNNKGYYYYREQSNDYRLNESIISRYESPDSSVYT